MADDMEIIATQDETAQGMRFICYTLADGRILQWSGMEHEQPLTPQEIIDLAVMTQTPEGTA